MSSETKYPFKDFHYFTNHSYVICLSSCLKFHHVGLFCLFLCAGDMMKCRAYDNVNQIVIVDLHLSEGYAVHSDWVMIHLECFNLSFSFGLRRARGDISSVDS